MKTHNYLDNTKQFYRDLYTYWYFQRDEVALRSKDAWPALCYMHDIFDIMQFPGMEDRLRFLQQRQRRRPGGVLDIGSGQGELSAVMSHMGYRVQSIDVCDAAEHYHLSTSRAFFGKYTDDSHDLYLGDLDAVAEHLDWSTIDTVVLVESIEHVYEDEWWRFYEKALPHLRANHARLVITNIKSMHPLRPSPPDHITLIDDVFYDRLAAEADATVFREFSHLVLDFAPQSK